MTDKLKCKNCLLYYDNDNFIKYKYKGNIKYRLSKCRTCKNIDNDIQNIMMDKKPILKLLNNKHLLSLFINKYNTNNNIDNTNNYTSSTNNNIDDTKIIIDDINYTKINNIDDTNNNIDDTKTNIDYTNNNIDDTNNNIDDTYNIDDNNINLDDNNINLDDTKTNIDDNNIKLDKFNPKILTKENFSILLNAKSKSGKSTLIRYLYNNYLKNNFDIVILFTDNEINKLYDFVDYENIYNDYHYHIVKTLFLIQKETNNKYKILFIFDDYIAKPGLKECRILKNLFARGRNSNMSVIYSTQYINLVSRSNRLNSNYLFVLNATQPSNNLMLYKDYLETYTKIFNKHNYNDMLIKFTNDYHILISDYMNSKLYTYKVPI